ncbi:MAG: LPXTG cell wall anchor domain-containing protein [Lactococcus lactis]|nr:LPXTG cell wall anchor domain-containing protein [Lactococcus lactis]
MKTLPETGVNSKADLSFVLIGIIIISSAVTILYKNR